MVLPEAVPATGIRPALDALYVYGFHDALGVVVRVPYEKVSERAELPLPVNGTVVAVATEDRRPGATVAMEGWTTPLLAYAYSPQTHSFADTGLQPRSPVDMSAITSREVLAPSPDGTMVPLSILYRKDLTMDGSNPTLLDAYGAYGITFAPDFEVTLPFASYVYVVPLAVVSRSRESYAYVVNPAPAPVVVCVSRLPTPSYVNPFAYVSGPVTFSLVSRAIES